MKFRSGITDVQSLVVHVGYSMHTLHETTKISFQFLNGLQCSLEISLRAAEDREMWKGIVTCNVICGAPITSKIKMR